MKEVKTDYYFKDMEACPCPEAFKDIKYVWQAINKKNISFSGNKITVGKDTRIHETALIEGPAIIGNKCTLKKGAYIRPYTIIGNNCSIGHNSEVKNSILFDNVVIAEKSYVGDSIAGKGVWIATGVTLSNTKMNKTNIRIYLDGNTYDTGMPKLGCIIGDGSKIGSQIGFNPGTLIGPEAVFYLNPPTLFPGKKIYRLDHDFKRAELRG